MTEFNVDSQLRLLVFAKTPIEGQVKTRLQPQFSPLQSVIIHQLLVEHCLQTITKKPFAAIELWVTGEHHWWQELAEKYSFCLYQQWGDNLGQRMLNAATDALSRGHKVVIIGTDCPFITADYLQYAFEKLQSTTDVVLGPAEDGGYVLIGFSKVNCLLFTNICWGSNQVLAQTHDRIQELDLSYCEIKTLRDIDRPEDVIYVSQQLPELANQFNKYTS